MGVKALPRVAWVACHRLTMGLDELSRAAPVGDDVMDVLFRLDERLQGHDVAPRPAAEIEALAGVVRVQGGWQGVLAEQEVGAPLGVHRQGRCRRLPPQRQHLAPRRAPWYP